MTDSYFNDKRLKENLLNINRNHKPKSKPAFMSQERFDRLYKPFGINKESCDQCDRNHWTNAVHVQKALYDFAVFKMCDICLDQLKILCKAQHYRVYIIYSRPKPMKFKGW